MRLGGSLADSAVTEAPADTVVATEVRSAEEPRLHHEPALDGLRGLAVVVVVLFHLEHLDGGFLGVDLFFVLSGFLITGLLLAERRNRGSIDLKRFWIRRARRLLPALLTMLAGVSAVLLVLTEQSQRARFRGEALATLGYVANWHQMGLETGYWDNFGEQSPLKHTWSLAIEEQFYVVWPVVAVLLLRLVAGRVRQVGFIALGGAALSFVALAALYSPVRFERAYFGTDARLGATLVGCALAAFVARRPRRQDRPAWWLELAAIAALVPMGVYMFTVRAAEPWYYRGGLATFALASAVVIFTVTGGPPGLLARVLSWSPLRGLGLISYGLYLWHWPVIAFATPERTNLDGVRLDVLKVGLSLLIAIVSYFALETPIRRGALTGMRVRVSTVGAMAVTLVVCLVATSGTPPAQIEEDRGLGAVPMAGSDDKYLIYPDAVPPDDMRVLLVGDSGPLFLGPVLEAEGHRFDTTVASSAPHWCNVANPEGKTQNADGSVSQREDCRQERHDLWERIIDSFDPDAVVYYLAGAGAPGKPWVDGEWTTDCETTYDSYLEGALSDEADLLSSKGATVFLSTSPYTNVPEAEADARTDCRNDVFADVAEAHPQVETVDMNGFVGEYQDSGVEMLRDLVHLTDDACKLVTDWLLPEIRTRLGR